MTSEITSADRLSPDLAGRECRSTRPMLAQTGTSP
jgi:hypothetical protein